MNEKQKSRGSIWATKDQGLAKKREKKTLNDKKSQQTRQWQQQARLLQLAPQEQAQCDQWQDWITCKPCTARSNFSEPCVFYILCLAGCEVCPLPLPLLILLILLLPAHAINWEASGVMDGGSIHVRNMRCLAQQSVCIVLFVLVLCFLLCTYSLLVRYFHLRVFARSSKVLRYLRNLQTMCTQTSYLQLPFPEVKTGRAVAAIGWPQKFPGPMWGGGRNLTYILWPVYLIIPWAGTQTGITKRYLHQLIGPSKPIDWRHVRCLHMHLLSSLHPCRYSKGHACARACIRRPYAKAAQVTLRPPKALMHASTGTCCSELWRNKRTSKLL